MTRILMGAVLLGLVAYPTSAPTLVAPSVVMKGRDALPTHLRAASFTAQAPDRVPLLTTAAELMAALEAGGEYRLAPGTYTGNFTIRRPTRLHGLPGTHRIAPADVAGVSLLAGIASQPVVTVLASDVVLDGLTIRPIGVDKAVVVVGDPAATSARGQPNNVTFDRVAVLATGNGGLRGFALHGSNLTIRRSYVAGFYYAGKDSQAIWALNGPGPYLIEDNFLEGAGENILFGGGSVKVPNLVPSDITVRGNTLLKRAEWRTKPGTVKNSIELKCANRVVVEGNIIDGNWRDAQDGSTIMLTARNQYGDNSWCGVDAVVVRDNVVRNAVEGYAVNILGHDNNFPSAQSQTITIEHNLFVDATNGIKIGRGVAARLTIARNTFPAITGQLVNFNGTAADGSILVRTPLVFDGNVGKGGGYGIKLDGVASGNPSLAAAATIISFARNVIEGTAARTISWPPETTVLPVGGLAPKLDADWHYTTDRTIGW